jgi:hypothetical protein
LAPGRVLIDAIVTLGVNPCSEATLFLGPTQRLPDPPKNTDALVWNYGPAGTGKAPPVSEGDDARDRVLLLHGKIAR